MSEIQKFDPSTLMQGVKDRIKSEFVSLIPDEQWTQMVQKECDDFFKPKDLGYNSRNMVSDFGILVRNQLEAEAKRRLAEYFKSPDFELKWEESATAPTCEAVNKMIVENSGQMLVNMFAGMFTHHLINFKNDLQRPY